MDKYKKLAGNSIIFTIGSFGSKLITFFMVPLYTHILSTSEYGRVDLITTTINLLLPLTTLELGQAALRFSIDAKTKENQIKIYNNIMIHSIMITIVLFIFTPLLMHFDLFGELTVLFVLLLIFNTINNLLAQYSRGIGLVKEFAFNGILFTTIIVASNVIFLLLLDFKVEGYILSLILASIISNLYLFCSINKGRKKTKFIFDIRLLKSMVKFSMPIIPNSAMWWIISGSTRYFILYFLGASANGLFAVANKLPAVISMITDIFAQSWQLSSYEEYDSDDREVFYSKIFNLYWVFLLLIGSMVLVILKPLLTFVVEETFYDSWRIVPFLIIAVIYQSFSAFLGTNYTAARQTKGTFFTSIYGGVISVASSIIFIPIIGVEGAGLSSALSFIGMFIVRLIDTKKFIKININYKKFISSNLILIIQIACIFVLKDLQLFFSQLFFLLLIFLINSKFIIEIIKKIIDMIKNRK